jgi:hypothetical protein
VAGLAERHLPGSSLGETFTRILFDQFTRLRDGDRYWYQHSLPANLVREVRGTSLAEVVRRNTRLTNLQPDIFFFRASIGGTVFADANGDGRRQPREIGLAGTTVALVDAAGGTVATTSSDARGNYVFKRLALGSFRVIATPPGGGAPPGRPSRSRGASRSATATWPSRRRRRRRLRRFSCRRQSRRPSQPPIQPRGQLRIRWHSRQTSPLPIPPLLRHVA